MVAAAMARILGEARPVLDRRDQLGEGPIWDAAGERLVWVDIHGMRVHELVERGDGWSAGRSWTTPAPVAAIVPRRGGGMLAMVGRQVCVLREDGSLDPFAQLDAPEGARFNDCKCDPRGRLLAGWLVSDLSASGALCRLDPDGTITTLLEDVGLANGMDWSPEGATFYFTDTLASGIDAFDYDLDAGTAENRRRVVTIPRGEGIPDGMCVDGEGCLWTAVLYSRQLRRYAPDGELLGVVQTPAEQLTSCAFGGRDGGELFITSIGEEIPRALPEGVGIPDEVIDAAGNNASNGLLFSCRPGVTGPPATPFG
jgi:sugar lactone lactonase YvrE